MPEMQAMAKEVSKPAVEKVHLADATAFEKKYEDFKDKAMQNLQTPLGDGRFTEWTGKNDEGVEMHGYRATILGSQRAFSFNTRCPESDWKNLKPAFEKVILSVKPGKTD
jgi:hypothetical protein